MADNLNATPAVVTFTNHPLQIIKPEAAPPLLTTPDEKRSLLLEAGASVIIMKPFSQQTRQLTATQFMKLLHERYDVDTIMLGFNNRFGAGPHTSFEETRQQAKAMGINLLQASEAKLHGDPISSTIIRNHLLNRQLHEANTLLGRPYTLTGTVVHGKQIGRTIGFPTANIQPDSPHKLIPANGVYACMATLASGKTYPAMVNIGRRPTVDPASPTISIEAHIIGIDKKLYGQSVTISFIHMLREEQKFSSLQNLRTQLQQDKINALNRLEFNK